MKVFFFMLVFQALFQCMSLTVFASEQSVSDSILTKDTIFLVADKIQNIDFEKLRVESDTTKKEELISEKNQVTSKKQKKSKKNRGKRLAVLTFVSAFVGLGLIVGAVVAAMSRAVGVIALLSTGLGLCLLALIMAYFAYSELSLFDQLTGNPHYFYHYLLRNGIQMAAAPFVFILIALLFFLYTRLANA